MKMAEPGPLPAAAGTDNDQLSRQYPKYYVVKGHLSEMLAQLAPGEPLPPERTLAVKFYDQPDHHPPGPARADHRGPAGAHAGTWHLRRPAQDGPAAAAHELHRGHAPAGPGVAFAAAFGRLCGR